MSGIPNPTSDARYLGKVRAETELEEDGCTCTGPDPADPCGHGDVADGCPVHDPNFDACEDCGEEAGNHSADCYTWETEGNAGWDYEEDG